MKNYLLGQNKPKKVIIDLIGQNKTIKVKIDFIGQNKPIKLKIDINCRISESSKKLIFSVMIFHFCEKTDP